MYKSIKSTFIILTTLLLLLHETLSERPPEEEEEEEWEKAFEDYIIKFGKVYSSQEEKEKRFKIYKERMEEVQKMNENENDAAYYGETRFSDMTKEEFSATFPAKMGVKTAMKDVEVPVGKLSDDVFLKNNVLLMKWCLVIDS